MLDQRPASHASEHLALPYIPFEFPRVFDTFAAWLFLAPRPREMLSNTLLWLRPPLFDTFATLALLMSNQGFYRSDRLLGMSFHYRPHSKPAENTIASAFRVRHLAVDTHKTCENTNQIAVSACAEAAHPLTLLKAYTDTVLEARRVRSIHFYHTCMGCCKRELYLCAANVRSHS